MPPEKTFGTLHFDRVVLCDYEVRDLHAGYAIADNLDGYFVKQTRIPDPDTLQQLQTALGDPASFGEDVMRCFMPHLGILYYLGDEVVCHISVCLICNQLLSSVPLPAEQAAGRRGFSADFRRLLETLSNFF